MAFRDAMNVMLNPIQSRGNTINPHITSSYGWRKSTQSNHLGVDFNYTGGQQSPYNQNHPNIYSPVSGTVTYGRGQGQYGTVRIVDAQGYEHKILHLNSRNVANGDRIEVGTQIGTMGGRGPTGPNHVLQHVHYEIRNPQGQIQDPENYWRTREPDITSNKTSLDSNIVSNTEQPSAKEVAANVHLKMAANQEKQERKLDRQNKQDQSPEIV